MTETGTVDSAPDRTRLFARLSWIAVGAAIACYLVHYLGGRSLWLDEIMVALNIKYLSFEELRGKLHYDQVAPIGWLYLERIAYNLTGNLEYGLRSVSLLAAVGAAVLFRQTVFKALPPIGAFCATAIFAFSGVLVRYAVEVKPYMVDVALSVAALWCAVSLLKASRLTTLSAGVFALVGFAIVLASFSAVYVLAVAGGVVFLRFALERRWASVAVLAGIAAAWLSLFAFLLLTIYLPNLQGTELTEGGASRFFARAGYAPIPPASASDIVWYFSWAERFIEFLFSREAWFPAALLIGLGVFGFIRRDWPLVALGIGPVLMMLIGSSFGILPAYERLTLFTAPGLILMAGAGAAYVTRLSRDVGIPAILLTSLVVAGSAGYLFGNLVKTSPPFAQHHLAPAFMALKQNLRPGDKVFIPNMALPAWVAYRERFGLGAVTPIEGVTPGIEWECTIRDMVEGGEAGRYWIVYIYNQYWDEPNPARLDAIVGGKGLSARYDILLNSGQVILVAADLAPRAGGPLPPPPPELCGSDGADDRFSIPEKIRRRAGLG